MKALFEIYDALIAQVATKTQADALLTLNPDHFTRLGADIADKVINLLPQ